MRVDSRHSEPTKSFGTTQEANEDQTEGVVRAAKKKKSSKPAVKVDLGSDQKRGNQISSDPDLAETYGQKRTSGEAAREEAERRGARAADFGED
ncbi:MAG: hypothetical protein AB7T49_15320 [Oligoflexales bacterium]